MPQGIDKRDEKIWDKAIDAFKKQYKKNPNSDRDYAIVSDIFDKMGGRFDHSEFTGLIEQFKEGMIMTKLDKLYESVCKEATPKDRGFKYNYTNNQLNVIKQWMKLDINTIDKLLKKYTSDTGKKDYHSPSFYDWVGKNINKESLSKLDRLHESVCKESYGDDLITQLKQIGNYNDTRSVTQRNAIENELKRLGYKKRNNRWVR
jgi:aromatic ring-cleaving dioxygenase